jgi:hypothetical protein
MWLKLTQNLAWFITIQADKCTQFCWCQNINMHYKKLLPTLLFYVIYIRALEEFLLVLHTRH